MNRYLPLVIVLFTCFIGSSSCSLLKRKKKDVTVVTDTAAASVVHADTSKPAVTPVPVPQPTTATIDSVVVPAPAAATAKLIADVTPIFTKRLTYKAFSGKAKIHVETPDAENEFAAHIRIRKDSVIWVNINLAGIPVARVFVTHDSIFMIDYYHKTAKILPLSQIAKILPAAVDFESLQNLVIGEPLVGGAVTNARYEGDSLFVKVEDSNYIQNITYLKADSTMHNEVLETRKPNGPVARSDYANYERVGDRRISAGRVIHVVNNGVMYLMEMDFSKIDFDGEQDYPFSIPNKYRE